MRCRALVVELRAQRRARLRRDAERRLGEAPRLAARSRHGFALPARICSIFASAGRSVSDFLKPGRLRQVVQVIDPRRARAAEAEARRRVEELARAGGADRSRGSARARRTRRAPGSPSGSFAIRSSSAITSARTSPIVSSSSLSACTPRRARRRPAGPDRRSRTTDTPLAPRSIARVLLSISFLYSVVLSSPANASRNRSSSVRSVSVEVARRGPREHQRARVRRRRVRIVDDRDRARLAAGAGFGRSASLDHLAGAAGFLRRASRRVRSSTLASDIDDGNARDHAHVREVVRRVVERADVLGRHRADRVGIAAGLERERMLARRRRGDRPSRHSTVSGASYVRTISL